MQTIKINITTEQRWALDQQPERIGQHGVSLDRIARKVLDEGLLARQRRNQPGKRK